MSDTDRHYPAMNYREIATFVAELRRQDDIAARALEFAILTAARTGEVSGVTWDEIDLPERRWSIPTGRTKTRKERWVPLSDSAVMILEKMAAIRQGEFVFPGGKAGQPVPVGAMAAVLKRLGRRDVTVHGFRRAFAEWACFSGNFPYELVEMVLGHVIRDPKRLVLMPFGYETCRHVMEAWAKFCSAPVAVAAE
jgi:integrase